VFFSASVIVSDVYVITIVVAIHGDAYVGIVGVAGCDIVARCADIVVVHVGGVVDVGVVVIVVVICGVAVVVVVVW